VQIFVRASFPPREIGALELRTNLSFQSAIRQGTVAEILSYGGRRIVSGEG
jgi:hypothetical protein